jgi:hypothetical protein
MSQETAGGCLAFLGDEADKAGRPFSEGEIETARAALSEAADIYRADLAATGGASAREVERGLASILKEAHQLQKRLDEFQEPRWQTFRRAARVSLERVPIGRGRSTVVVKRRRNKDWLDANAARLNRTLEEVATHCANALKRIKDPDFRSLWWAPNGRPVDWPFRRLVAISIVIFEHFCGRATASYDEEKGGHGKLVDLIAALNSDFGLKIAKSKLGAVKDLAGAVRRDGLDSNLLEPAYRPLLNVAPTIFTLSSANKILNERKRIFSTDRGQPLRHEQK